jgi:UDP-glucuronate decarboxylase
MQRQAAQRGVIVAGAAGFIGSHLCDALIGRGFSVVGLDNFRTGRADNIAHLLANPNFRFMNADIIDPPPRSLRADIIFNLACAASPPHYQADPVHTMMTSVAGTRNLLALAADTGARFVLASTSEVYGDPLCHPQREDYCGNVNPIGPRACYDEGKRAAEALSFDYLRAGLVETCVARIFNTYGPRMRADDGRLISNVVTQALSGDDISIYGDGKQTRSFCYVDDLVEGLLALALTGEQPASPVNLGNPAEITVAEVAELVIEMTGSRSKLARLPLPADDPRRRKPDIGLANQLLGWNPRTSLRQGLATTIDWFADTRGRWTDGKHIVPRRRAKVQKASNVAGAM